MRIGRNRKKKFESERQEGLRLGHNRESNETIVDTRGGVIRAYPITREIQDERWDPELINNTKGTPQQPDPSKPVPMKINLT